jgi:hypothetical protein
MKEIIDGLTAQKSAADKREFTRGALGMDKFNAASFAGGWLAGWLLTPKPKKKNVK